jgi:hypothetical protein
MQVIDQYEQTQGINVLHPEEHEGAKEVYRDHQKWKTNSCQHALRG